MMAELQQNSDGFTTPDRRCVSSLREVVSAAESKEPEFTFTDENVAQQRTERLNVVLNVTSDGWKRC